MVLGNFIIVIFSMHIEILYIRGRPLIIWGVEELFKMKFFSPQPLLWKKFFFKKVSQIFFWRVPFKFYFLWEWPSENFFPGEGPPNFCFSISSAPQIINGRPLTHLLHFIVGMLDKGASVSHFRVCEIHISVGKHFAWQTSSPSSDILNYRRTFDCKKSGKCQIFCTGDLFAGHCPWFTLAPSPDIIKIRRTYMASPANFTYSVSREHRDKKAKEQGALA